MRGQWFGSYTGSSKGMIVVNVDEMKTAYQGVAYLLESDRSIPNAAVFFRTVNKEATFKFRTSDIRPINPQTGIPDAWSNVRDQFAENAYISGFADVEGQWSENSLQFSWKTDREISGNSILAPSRAGSPSELVSLDRDWDSYKQHISSLEGHDFIVRGQNMPWRLRTSFHRTGRSDLWRFINEDVQILHRHLSSRTKHVFNLEKADENGAFYNLLQHHGYPTPLLDWTHSPYVAAFFAYRGISKAKAAMADEGAKVRIYFFNLALWKKNLLQINNMLFSGPHLSAGEFLGIENERMIPQQSVTTITNIDDIEGYIKSCETEEIKYLSAIDLPVHNRDKVVQELRYMGITAGSMFPGLDGVCEELKDRNFDV
jgi:hypothetical protein